MYSYEKEPQMLVEQNCGGQDRTAQDSPFLSGLSGKTVMLSGATGMIGKYMIDFLMCCNDSRVFEAPVHIIALSRSEACARRSLEGKQIL